MKNICNRSLLKTFLSKKKNMRGFSLIEILVAITLVGLIVGAIGVAVFSQLKKGQKGVASTQVTEISKALELYFLDKGRYPTDAEGLDALVKSGDMKEVPLDPWGNAYVYKNPGVHNQSSPDVYSKGPDGVESEDDVGNWKEKSESK